MEPFFFPLIKKEETEQAQGLELSEAKKI